jgi:hypothetical protein
MVSNQFHRTSGNGVETRPRGVNTHALANELTDERRVQAKHNPPGQVDTAGEPQPRDQVLNKTQRSIAQLMIGLVAILIIAGFIVAAALTGQWLLLGPALIVFIPFMIFLLLPVWLASTTKIAQDQAVKHSARPDGRDGQAMNGPDRR